MLTEDIIENKKRVKRLKEVIEMLDILQYEFQLDDDPPDSTYISKLDKAIKVLQETHEATDNGINTADGYYKYDVYKKFEEPLLAEGWQVIVFIPSKEEDADRITCGNALLSVKE